MKCWLRLEKSYVLCNLDEDLVEFIDMTILGVIIIGLMWRTAPFLVHVLHANNGGHIARYCTNKPKLDRAKGRKDLPQQDKGTKGSFHQ